MFKLNHRNDVKAETSRLIPQNIGASGGLRVGGPEARLKRGRSGDAIILSRAW